MSLTITVQPMSRKEIVTACGSGCTIYALEKAIKYLAKKDKNFKVVKREIIGKYEVKAILKHLCPEQITIEE